MSLRNHLFGLLVASGILVSALGCKAESPVVHIRYDTTIEGYSIKIEWNPFPYEDAFKEGMMVRIGGGSALIYITDVKTKKTVVIDDMWITIPEWDDKEHKLQLEETVVLKYVPPARNEIIPDFSNQIVFFSDVDYDGKKELIVNCYRGGRQLANLYSFYKISNGKLNRLSYRPFYDKEYGGLGVDEYSLRFIPERKIIEYISGNFLDTEHIKVYQFDGTGAQPKLIETRWPGRNP